MSHTHSGESLHTHQSSPQPHKTTRNILLAFLLNLGFSIYEFVGGAFTGSTAIMSDAIHDFGDALSIGISFFLEKKSEQHPDQHYTYGYARYSLVGGMITTLILLLGSTFVIASAIPRLINPIEINYNSMILLALIGVIINSVAAFITHRGNSLNQKSVNLHMLEDVLGWIVVLIGAIIMRFTNISYLDPILSILVALFILKQALANFISILNVFLEKIPAQVSLEEIEKHLLNIPGVKNVHHLHIWSLDGYHNYATLHVVSNEPNIKLKQTIKSELSAHQIAHSTIEMENTNENCHDQNCKLHSIDRPHTHHCHKTK